jgi:hypothetical protein
MATPAAPVSFAATIKPYFTQLDRQMMMDSTHTAGFTIDLWDAAQVQKQFNLIAKVVARGQMPPPPPDSDGPWPPAKITQFGIDFTAWQAGGFQP